MKATVITDASFCPETNAAGWAAWVAHDKGRVKKCGSFKRAPKGSGQAELWAAINGVALAIKAGATDVFLQTDCMEVVNLLNQNPDKLWRALLLVKITARPAIKAVHVRGHTTWAGKRYWVNRWCDSQAGSCMRHQRKLLCK